MKEIRERLTYRDADGYAMMKERGGFKREGVERLAEFEDTTLSPQDCREYKSLRTRLLPVARPSGN